MTIHTCQAGFQMIPKYSFYVFPGDRFSRISLVLCFLVHQLDGAAGKLTGWKKLFRGTDSKKYVLNQAISV